MGFPGICDFCGKTDRTYKVRGLYYLCSYCANDQVRVRRPDGTINQRIDYTDYPSRLKDITTH